MVTQKMLFIFLGFLLLLGSLFSRKISSVYFSLSHRQYVDDMLPFVGVGSVTRRENFDDDMA
jgi:hypothetical protein